MDLICPVCSDIDLEPLYRISGFSLFRCRTCTTVSISPRLPYEEVATCYAGIHGTVEIPLLLRRDYKARLFSQPFTYLLSLDPLARLIERFRPVGRLLDVGCGTGAFLYAMRERGWICEGLEPIPEAAQICREKLGLVVQQSTLDEADFSVYFDVVVLNHVFEHLPDPHKALNKLRQFLAAGGILVITVPNGDSWGARLFGQHWSGYDVPRHYCTYTPVGLGKLAEMHGLKLEYCGTVRDSHSGTLNSLQIMSQARPDSRWLDWLVAVLRNPLVSLAALPLNYVPDRLLGMGHELTYVLRSAT